MYLIYDRYFEGWNNFQVFSHRNKIIHLNCKGFIVRGQKNLKSGPRSFWMPPNMNFYAALVCVDTKFTTLFWVSLRSGLLLPIPRQPGESRTLPLFFIPTSSNSPFLEFQPLHFYKKGRLISFLFPIISYLFVFHFQVRKLSNYLLTPRVNRKNDKK